MKSEMHLENSQILLLGWSVQCFLLIMLLESRVRILAMLSAALGCLFFVVVLAWPLITNREFILWMDDLSQDTSAWLLLVSAFCLSAYLVRNFPPPAANRH